MVKKRKFSKRKKEKRSPKHSRTDNRRDPTRSLENSVLTILAKEKEPITLSAISNSLTEFEVGKKEVEETIAHLVRRREVIAAGKKRFQLDPKGHIFSGKVEKHAKGFGFVTELKPQETARFFTKDPFLSVRGIGSANHGDRVLIRVNNVRKDGRPEAQMLAVLDRFGEQLTGFYKPGSPPRVVPEDPRYPSNIEIVEAVAPDIGENDVVIVQVLPQPSQRGLVRGKIVEVLGSAQNIDVQMRMVIEKHNLPHIFPPAVLHEAEALSFGKTEEKGRLDLRDTMHITIDGETAKDFDDAIALEKTRGGYKLYVSIADVGHFVRPGTELDKEAYLRGTSIYFPGRVIPMLPENLSNNLCSLVPGEDRLTFSAILDFNKKGILQTKKFSKSIIRSKHRFTYTTVKQILIDKDPQVRKKHQDFLTPLKWAEELAVVLYARRMERGSIGFNIPEPEITLNESGRIESIRRKERNFAHQIIEEFMLAANEAVAQSFTAKNLECIYRIHEEPAREKVNEFASFAATLGIELPVSNGEPQWFAGVVDTVRGKPTEYVVNNLLLRTMQQARYDSVNVGHFGLAATDYTHFTSPIRRYPDLLVHRFLQSMLDKREEGSTPGQESIAEMAKHLSGRERAAVTAEREMADRLKIFFMEQFIGESFAAVISGVSESVLFVELIDMFVSGSIDITALTDDYYLYDLKRYRLIGEITAKTYQLGDVLKVTLIDVDHRRKRINFAPTQENTP